MVLYHLFLVFTAPVMRNATRESSERTMIDHDNKADGKETPSLIKSLWRSEFRGLLIAALGLVVGIGAVSIGLTVETLASNPNAHLLRYVARPVHIVCYFVTLLGFFTVGYGVLLGVSSRVDALCKLFQSPPNKED
jgi:hypothetical protein